MTDVKIFAITIEDEAKQQVDVLAQQKSFLGQKIRIMPDVHAGKGCVIGFTSTTGDYIVPNVVGVDIGCGMWTVSLGHIDIDLQKLDDTIRQHVPSGFKIHEGRICKFEALPTLKCYRQLKDTKRLERSIGTLGGGNHFIELCQDSDANKYLIVHTGSRNLGKQVAEYYQKLAHGLLQGKDIDVPKDLAYLTGEYMEDYLHDMGICQAYATLNRRMIAERILSHIGLNPTDFNAFETTHNFVDLDTKIVRKGAIRANAGELVLIPLNMRDGCILAKGKGNPDWNYSAPHGAGRLMSRTQAKASFTMAQYKESMAGVFTTSVNKSTLDELPMAYKKMSDIVDVIGDTVDILHIIKPIYNFKASE